MKSTTSHAPRARTVLYDAGGTATAVVLGLTTLGLIAYGVPESGKAAAEVTRLDGPTQPLGNGSMRTYIEVLEGAPISVGVALTEGALEGLPRSDVHWEHMSLHDAHALVQEWVLELPSPNPTPFTHVSFNWNPAGHEPEHVYTRPHFDFHFNIIPDAERRTIVPDNPFWAEKEAHLPRPELMPAGFASMDAAVPLMGVHWIDPTSAELRGEVFTQTFIFGSWDGRLIFAEPMITKAFLESRPDFRAGLPLPLEVEEPGYYPTAYGIRWNEEAREYRVSLEGLVAVR